MSKYNVCAHGFRSFNVIFTFDLGITLTYEPQVSLKMVNFYSDRHASGIHMISSANLV